MAVSDALVRTHQFPIAAVGTAGNDLVNIIGEVPFAGTVTRCVFIPATTITGANTNTRSHTLTNRTQSLAAATLQYNSGVNATQYAEKTIVLSGTAANVTVAAGDVLSFDSTHIGTGITDPGGVVVVDFTRGEASQ